MTKRLLLVLVAVLTALSVPLVASVSAEPQPDPCYDYVALEAGRGAPERQDVFNHLDARGYARWRMACVYGWGVTQYDCLDRLWTEESGWYHFADGAGSTWGIPQAYPGNKMASFGDDWYSNPRTQVKWGLQYIADRYGAPTKAGVEYPYSSRACDAGY